MKGSQERMVFCQAFKIKADLGRFRQSNSPGNAGRRHGDGTVLEPSANKLSLERS